MKKLFLLLFVFCCQISLMAQATDAFNLTGISVFPAAPTPNDTVYLTLTGDRLDSCTVLNNFSNINGINTIVLNLEFSIEQDSFPGVECQAAVIPFDTTICVGVLPPTTYTVFYSGSNFTNMISPAFTFNVAPDDCVDDNGVIWVTSNGDAGNGSLREAIDCANLFPGPNLIRFYLPTTTPNEFRIGTLSGSALPPITDPGTIIDGTTQPGWGAGGNLAPKIILNGDLDIWTAPVSGLDIQASDTEIYGLEIKNFVNDGIKISNATNVKIGAAGAGNVIHSNGADQDFFPDAPPGSGPFDGAGIHLGAGTFACQVNGNWIGTNVEGANGLGNELSGVFVSAGAGNSSIGTGGSDNANTIQENPIGTLIEGGGITVSENIFLCNEEGIILQNNGNGNLGSPIIDLASTTSISGTVAGSSSGTVEVFLNDPTGCNGAACQGAVYMGTAVANVLGWTLNAPFENGVVLQGGERITATLNSGGRQSEFSICKVVIGIAACTDANGEILVTNANDEGPGSLREAINCANATIGSNLISFNFGGGANSILVGSTSGLPLPAITSDGTIIDGSAQGGIVLDGSGAVWNLPADGLTINADLCEIYGLQIINFPDDGITLDGALGNKIGALGKGNVVHSNGSPQDFWPGVSGGPYNGSGIHLMNNSSGNMIFGNAIGTDAAGNLNGGNEFCGILLQPNCSSNQLGSSLGGSGNLIYNNATGIQIGTNGLANTILQNELTCNTDNGIVLDAGANADLQAPTFLTARTDSIFGTAVISSGTIELYLLNNDNCATSPCQGSIRIGAQDFSNGSWLFTEPFLGGVNLVQGDFVTAIVTDSDGNSSAYAACEIVLNPCFVSLEELSHINATCGLSNGEVTVEASNGTPPYIFNIGNGPTTNPTFSGLSFGFYNVTVSDFLSCTAELEFFISDTPSPDLILLVNNGTTCRDSSGSLNYIATGGTPDYNYSINGGPFQSSGLFENLPLGIYEVIVSDDNGCTTTDQQSILNTGEFPIAGFTFTTDFLTLDFSDESLFADSVFYDFGDGSAGSNLSNPTHTYAAAGTYTVCQYVNNTCGADTLCRIVMPLEPTDILIAGTIFREDLATIANVELTCINSDTTGVDGAFLIDGIPNGVNCTIAPEKSDIARRGINITDVVLLQRHLVFLDTLDSPYKIIAADVNGSNSINISDVVFLQRVILFLDNDFPIGKTWRFIPEDYIFIDPMHPFDEPFAESISYNGITSDQVDQNFYGFKLGDINLSASPQSPPNQTPVSLVANTKKEGQWLTMEFSFANDNSLNGFQGKLNFDNKLLRPINLESTLSNFKYNTLDAGISFLWYDELATHQGVQMSNAEPAFTFTFQLLGDEEEAIESLSLDNDHSLSFSIENGEHPFALTLEATTLTSILALNSSAPYSIAPNPFTDEIWVHTDGTMRGDYEWVIYNAQGGIVTTGSIGLAPNKQTLLYNGERLSGGVYLLSIGNGEQYFTQRILKFE